MLHAGYQALLEKYPDAEVLLVGTSWVEDFPVLRKEIRALHPETAAAWLRASGRSVRVVERGALVLDADTVVVPDEELTRYTWSLAHRTPDESP